MTYSKPDGSPGLWKKTGLIALGTVAGLLLGEVIVRRFHPLPSRNYLHEPHLLRTFHPAAGVMPGVEGTSRFKVNSLGIRGDEIESFHNYRILVFGGSSAECLYLDQEESWPDILQQELNEKQDRFRVWVGNAGKTGVSSREHRYQIPILVNDTPKVDAILLMTGVNDLLLRLAQDADYDPDFCSKLGAKEFLLGRAFHIVADETESSKPVPRIRTLDLLGKILFSKLGSPAPANATHLVEDQAGLLYEQRRRYRRDPLAVRDQTPDLSSGLREFETNLRACVEEAKKKSVRIILLTQPTLWDGDLTLQCRDLLWTGGVGNISGENLEYYSVEALAAGIEEYNQTTIRVAREMGVEWIDLGKMLPKNENTFYDDCHFNETGAKEVADILTGRLSEKPPFLHSPDPSL